MVKMNMVGFDDQKRNFWSESKVMDVRIWFIDETMKRKIPNFRWKTWATACVSFEVCKSDVCLIHLNVRRCHSNRYRATVTEPFKWSRWLHSFCWCHTWCPNDNYHKFLVLHVQLPSKISDADNINSNKKTKKNRIENYVRCKRNAFG